MELLRSTSYRGFSVRRIFMFALTVLFTALLGALTLSAPTHAAPAADWKGESILYNGDQFFGPVEAKSGDSHGLANGTIYYLSVEQVSERPLVQKAHVIYFAPGASPPTETSANYAVYDYSASKVFSNPQDRQTITLTPQGDSSSYSSCSVDGIGWIICPVTVFLADAMDNVFEFVSNFMAVQPLNVTDPNSPLYTAWNVMRSIANVAFIIAFMIIIYSQLTGAGISSYGLKKLLPRLVVAAILVNVSFYITAIAVDLSNIAGYSLQDILIKIRQDTFAITDSTWDASNGEGWGVEGGWSALTTLVLSGGAAAAGFAGISAATGGSIGAALYLLIPILIGLLLTILLVLLILAARQAIIIILIVIAPLAFVANTEKWFDKWRDLFMTMLIFFPAFSLVFGGSQLAGGIIIQNSTNIIMIIFGMAVQIAPLVITPLLLKLSGSLLGRIAQIANDPSKGLLDRTKNWSKDRAEMNRLRSLSDTRGRVNPFRGVAKGMDNGNRVVKKRTAIYEQLNDNRFEETHQAADLHEQEYVAKTAHEMIETSHKQHVQEKINKPTSRLHLQNTQLEAGKLALERTVQATNSDISEYRASDNPTGMRPDLKAAITRLNTERQTLSIEKMRGAAAEGVQQEKFADALIRDVSLQQRAGGIDEHGADGALAGAINTVRESYGKSINEARAIVKHFNLSSNQRQEHAMGREFTVTREEDGVSRTFTMSDIFTREAAIEDQVATGTVPQVEEIVAASGSSLKDFRTSISTAIAKNGLGAKTLYLGGKTIDDISQGRFNTPDDLMAAVVETIGKGKISEKDLASIDKDAVQKLADAAELIRNGNVPANTDPNLLPDLQRRLEQFSLLAQDTLLGDERVNVKPNSKEHILRVARILNPTFQEAPLPRPPEED